MSRRHYTNNAPVTTLSSSMTNIATTCTVTTATGMPSSLPWTAIIDAGLSTAEVVLVTAVVGTTLTVTRGYDGTAAQAHANGAAFAHVAVQADFDEANSHVNATTAIHGVVGTLVGTTDTQTLTNKTLTSPAIAGASVTGTVSGGTYTGASLTSPTVTGTATVAAVTASGTVQTNGSLIANGSGTSLQVSHDLAVGGNVGITGTLGVTGAVTVGGLTGGVVPAGSVFMHAAAAAPTGYLLCDGSAVSRTTYSTLFASISTQYGAGDGSTTFNVPDLRGRFPVGVKSTDTDFDVRGDTGGQKAHAHTLSSNAWADVSITGSAIHERQVTASSWTETTSGTTTGGSTSASLTNGAQLGGSTDISTGTTALPPFIALNFIIKT